jgi:hypothetical protein
MTAMEIVRSGRVHESDPAAQLEVTCSGWSSRYPNPQTHNRSADLVLRNADVLRDIDETRTALRLVDCLSVRAVINDVSLRSF